ncbi:MFS transporter [Streptomyces olivaceus]|uniref:MFS transporter n=1 Tax=Streptomyces olivaceus TaxID=47716 RepID=A0ABS7W444_STROV|nr:MFS transporter [Streptomyces olivaceus]MBZ6089625.1 MFS transporter [Streptomyces olivaceus]MBZ6098604.1 MFS transporter [Streptomyces olivaceus]MBZ6120016.1 MFS transporter [Streptomyces olivaceus]MBZ6152329.1 MFS transporter [Streptomyces olivaceus]MBZ6199780.1 MFS transporter [Streptomyces olivaceus]
MRVSRLNDPFLRGQLAIAALFLSLGFQYATWAARIPALKSDLDLSAGEVGVLLMAAGVGSAVTFPAVAYLMRRLGSRSLALLSQLGLALALPALAAAPNYPVALLVMCADGVLVGGLNVAMNAQGAALETRHERNTMARLHATFSAGSLLAALVASGMTAATDSVLAHFGVAAVLLAALNLTSRTGLLEQDAPAQDAPAEDTPAETAAPEPARRRWTLPSRLTLWMCCAMVFGTVAEGAMNDWSALYLRDVAEASAELAPLGIAVVSGMMVVARVFADGWRARWGDGRVVLVGSTAAGAGLAAALVSGGVAPALAGFACMGLGIAAVTPCVYAAAARQGSDALTLVAAMGTTGLLAGPPLIGFIASASSLAWGMGAVAASAVAVALCGTRIRWTATPVVREEAAA